MPLLFVFQFILLLAYSSCKTCFTILTAEYTDCVLFDERIHYPRNLNKNIRIFLSSLS